MTHASDFIFACSWLCFRTRIHSHIHFGLVYWLAIKFVSQAVTYSYRFELHALQIFRLKWRTTTTAALTIETASKSYCQKNRRQKSEFWPSIYSYAFIFFSFDSVRFTKDKSVCRSIHRVYLYTHIGNIRTCLLYLNYDYHLFVRWYSINKSSFHTIRESRVMCR